MANTAIIAVSAPGLPVWYVPVTLPQGEVGRGWTVDVPGQRSPPPEVASVVVTLAVARHEAAQRSPSTADIRPRPAAIDAIRAALARFGGTARTGDVAAVSGYCVATCIYTLPHVARRVRRGVWSLA